MYSTSPTDWAIYLYKTASFAYNGIKSFIIITIECLTLLSGFYNPSANLYQRPNVRGDRDYRYLYFCWLFWVIIFSHTVSTLLRSIFVWCYFLYFIAAGTARYLINVFICSFLNQSNSFHTWLVFNIFILKFLILCTYRPCRYFCPQAFLIDLVLVLWLHFLFFAVSITISFVHFSFSVRSNCAVNLLLS